MLTAAVLSAAAGSMDAFSPRNSCRVRMANGRYRHDPYNAKIFMSPAKNSASSPSHSSSPSTCPAPATPKKVETPKKPAMRFAVVLFKHETCMYKAPFRVEVGDHVVVEADRGENIGTVQQILADAPAYEVPNKVLRRASANEIADTQCLRESEVETTSSVQRLSESIGLSIRIVDTEFQTDMNKLTVYFSSKIAVDFRKLQRVLFRDYRCRIWLVNWSEVEARKRQADRCLAMPLCSKLGSRLSTVTKSHHTTNAVANTAQHSAARRSNQK